MPILPYTPEYLPAAAALWNAHAQSEEMPHKRLSQEAFAAKFVTPAAGLHKVNNVLVQDGGIIGFASGAYKAGTAVGYVTFVLVDGAHRRRGAGTALLHAVEEGLAAAATRENGKPASLEARFFNPVTLEWVVPGSPGHDHPNAPGVDVAGKGYLFLKNNGYRDVDHENAYYRRLEGFAHSPAIARSLEALGQQGIEITRYDPARHTGLAELLDDLGSEDWRNILLSNAARPDGGRPLLIVAHGARVCGFAGPLDVQPSGRGYFAGIGVHSAYRQRGAGKALFSCLCMNLQDIGAQFMTLFTGESNPARNIYESAGFRIVKCWAGMRKTMEGQNHGS